MGSEPRDASDQGGSTSVFNLEFVNMNAGSETERQRNQQIIRSTAMKNFHHKQQLQRIQEKGGSLKNVAKKKKEAHSKSKKTSRLNDPDDATEMSSGSSSEETVLDLSSLVSTLSASSSDSSFGPGESSRHKDFNRLNSWALSAASSPTSLLGAGRIDPFRIQPVDMGSHMPELIDHSVSILWPGLGPGRPDGTGSKISSAWLEKVYERPLVMHAMLFGAAVHMDVLRRPRLSVDNPIRLFHKVQTMRLLKEELKNPDKISLDDAILAVLALGTNEVETVANNINKKIRTPFNSPLSSLQWLDVYGSISHTAVHVTAMRSLVSRQGGLDNIQLRGLADVLSFADTLGATQSLSHPYWPLLDRNLPLSQDIVNSPVERLGQGFQDLLAFGINDSAASVFQAMTDLAAVIDCHLRGIKPISDIVAFIDRRNVVQHSLMSLPRGDELNYGEVNSVCLYESIRHAAIIYSAAVTFPLPPHAGVFRMLATLLQKILEECKFDPCWQLCPRALLWILVLGGIASFDTVERTWYVQNLAAVSAALNLSEWEEVAEELGNYLWLQSACEGGGRLLWVEVLSDRPYLEENILGISEV